MWLFINLNFIYGVRYFICTHTMIQERGISNQNSMFHVLELAMAKDFFQCVLTWFFLNIFKLFKNLLQNEINLSLVENFKFSSIVT